MAAAAILSLEAFRDAHRRTEVRQYLHDRFDAWLNRLEAHMEDRTPTLEQLTQAVLALRRELTQAATEGGVEQAHRVVMAPRTSACPQCGQMLSARGPQDRTVERQVGAVRLRRPSFDCKRRHLHHPVGRGAAGGRAPQATRRAAAVVQLTKELPDERACERFEELTGLPLSAHTAHEVTQAVSEARRFELWSQKPFFRP